MGAEIAQEREWSHDRSLDWHMLEWDQHRGVQKLVAELNRTYRQTPALYERDFTPDGFRWIDASDADNNVLSFLRISADGNQHLACIANLAPQPQEGYRLGLPVGGRWREVVNTDGAEFAGSGIGNGGTIEAGDESWHGLPNSAAITLPPLAVLWLAPE
jgi:1,4-alpha-glucan branching enzyme